MARYELICEDCHERVVIDSNWPQDRQACGCAGVVWYAQPARITRVPDDTEEVLCILPKPKR